MSFKQKSFQFSGLPDETNTGLGFYKIIYPAIIEEQKFELPSGFVKKHGYKLSDVATLEVPNGDVWQIKLLKVDGNIRFVNGWKDFVNHHSISTGHVLFFRYEGCSNFYVIICDMSAVEIDYPSKNKNPEEASLDRDIIMPEKNSVNLDKTSEAADTFQPHQTTELVQTIGEPSQKHGRLLTPLWIPQALTQKPWVQESSAIQSAMAYESENPSFMVVMEKAFVHDNFALNVPFSLIKNYLGRKPQVITLCVYDDVSHMKVWRVNCCVHNETVRLYQWKEFSIDNALGEHDVCVFELTRMENVTFKVSIFRAEAVAEEERTLLHGCQRAQVYGSDLPIQEEGSGKQVTKGRFNSTVPLQMRHQVSFKEKEAVEAVHRFKSDYPSFIVGLSATYVHGGYVHIPAKFAYKYLPRKPKIAMIVNSEGRTWFLKYKFTNKAFLCNGWDAVVMGNDLKEESFCAFELIDDGEELITMKIIPIVV